MLYLMVVRRIWTWLLVEYMTLARLEMRLCNPLTKVVNLSEWELDGLG